MLCISATPKVVLESVLDTMQHAQHVQHMQHVQHVQQQQRGCSLTCFAVTKSSGAKNHL